MAAARGRITLEYLGHEVGLDVPAPRVESSLDPLPALLGYGAILKLLTIAPALGGMPVPVTLAAAGCDVAAMRRQWRERSRDEDAVRRTLPLVLAGAAGRRRRRWWRSGSSARPPRRDRRATPRPIRASSI